MSPLVIARNQASSQNLVDSTKIERIKIDSKSAHRKEKKEKKERRKHKSEKHEKSKSKSKSHKHSKKVADDSELERSGLTEELERPQNLQGYDSDGSHNSKKRKRDDSPPAVESLVKAAPVAGKPLRIRLIFKKPKVDDSPSLPREDPLVCSTSVAEPLNHSEKVEQDSVPSSIVSVPEENLPSTSAAAVAETKKRRKHRPSKEERYNALFDDWTPSICFPAMEVDSSKNDEDGWLFGNKAQEKSNPKAAAAKIDEDVSMSLDSRGVSSWPRAQFLPEVGIYSLPYTVPF